MAVPDTSRSGGWFGVVVGGSNPRHDGTSGTSQEQPSQDHEETFTIDSYRLHQTAIGLLIN